MKTPPLPTRARPARDAVEALAPRRLAGFTLVEMLVVITIIGMLAALVTVAARAALKRANVAAIVMDISQLDAALKAYKEKFGEYPPDFAGLQNPTYVTNAQAAVLRHLARAFPRFVITGPSPNPWVNLQQWVLTQTNSAVDINALSPSNALAFWLGGLPGPDGALSGFAADPANPFAPPTGFTIYPAGVTPCPSRIGPFIEFERSRLNGFLYYPPRVTDMGVANAYVYFRAENNAYTYDGSPALANFANVKLWQYPTASPVVAVYPAADWRVLKVAPFTWVNRSSFQIFSAGRDATYGLATGVLQFPTGVNYLPATYDDITNFSGGGTLEDAVPP